MGVITAYPPYHGQVWQYPPRDWPMVFVVNNTHIFTVSITLAEVDMPRDLGNMAIWVETGKISTGITASICNAISERIASEYSLNLWLVKDLIWNLTN